MGHFKISYTYLLIVKVFQTESWQLQDRLGLSDDANCGNSYSNV